MTHKDINKLKAIQETLETEGRNQFNNNSLPYDERQKGLEKHDTARKLLQRIGDLQTGKNLKKKK
jgi:hypothetical protein